MHKILTHSVLAATGIAVVMALAPAGPASAAPEFPCRTAKLIVPWGPGGGTGVISA